MAESPKVHQCEPAIVSRPPFIRSTSEVSESTHVYPQSTKPMGPVRRLGKEAGLERIGVNIQRLPPARRSSWPHAEENDEEFAFIEGEADAWIDGNVCKMRTGDLAAFPVGTGISHCFINGSDREVVLLVGGEAPRPSSRIFYPIQRAVRTWVHQTGGPTCQCVNLDHTMGCQTRRAASKLPRYPLCTSRTSATVPMPAMAARRSLRLTYRVATTTAAPASSGNRPFKSAGAMTPSMTATGAWRSAISKRLVKGRYLISQKPATRQM